MMVGEQPGGPGSMSSILRGSSPGRHESVEAFVADPRVAAQALSR
jgi:hypothetical protein